jgi:hypothetical protein
LPAPLNIETPSAAIQALLPNERRVPRIRSRRPFRLVTAECCDTSIESSTRVAIRWIVRFTGGELRNYLTTRSNIEAALLR